MLEGYHASAFRHSGATHSRPRRSNTSFSPRGKNIFESYRRVLCSENSERAVSTALPVAQEGTHIPELSNFIALHAHCRVSGEPLHIEPGVRDTHSLSLAHCLRSRWNIIEPDLWVNVTVEVRRSI